MSIVYVVKSGDKISSFLEWGEIERFVPKGVEGISIFAFSSTEEADAFIFAPTLDPVSMPHAPPVFTVSRFFPTPPDDVDDEADTREVQKKRKRQEDESLHAISSFALQPVEPSVIVIEEDDDDPTLFREKEMQKSVSELLIPYEPKVQEELSADQKHVFDLVKARRSIFFTGAAGTGKSFLFRKIREYLISIHGVECVGVTATTGAAAINVRGITIHSYAGLGIGEGTIEEMCAKARANKLAKKRIENCRVLMIDEISMLTKKLFTATDAIFKKIRGRSAPFGGVQLVLAGDFLQLPPVNKTNEPNEYAFDSHAWLAAVPEMFALQVPHRQTEATFFGALNDMRRGKLTPIVREMLLPRVNAKVELPVKLYPHVQTVEAENRRQLDLIRSEPMTFTATDTISNILSPDRRQALQQTLDKLPVDSTLTLKNGALVVLLRNLDLQNGLCNGAQGKVVGFSRMSHSAPIVQFRNGVTKEIPALAFEIEEGGVVLAARKQVPLALAYALTIHKAQGMTLDAVQCDVSRAFAPGQAYVALSRTRTLEGLSLDSMPSIIEADPRAVKFHRDIGD
jgi:ATP-dependent DNA helicase PIF1